MNARAMERAWLLPPGVAAPAIAHPPPAKLGQMDGSYRMAITHLEGIQANYNNLVQLIGKDAADQALVEAREAVEKAKA